VLEPVAAWGQQREGVFALDVALRRGDHAGFLAGEAQGDVGQPRVGGVGDDAGEGGGGDLGRGGGE